MRGQKLLCAAAPLNARKRANPVRLFFSAEVDDQALVRIEWGIKSGIPNAQER